MVEYDLELVPLTNEIKEYYTDKLNENVDSNEIICYKNIVYEGTEDKIIIGKSNNIGELPDDEESDTDEDIYYSYELTIPIFSIAQSVKFIILEGDILEYFKSNAEKYFKETEDLLLLYNESKKSYHLTIGIKEEVKSYNNGQFSQYLLINYDNFDINKFKKLDTKDEYVYMNNILKKCNKIIEENIQTYDTYKDNNKCLACLQYNYNPSGNDKYDCLVKVAYYSIFYGRLYVSEIYYFLKRSQILEKIMNNKKDIKVLSLGCGFMPDLIAIDKYKNDMWLKDVEIGYQGYDIEALWKEIVLCPQCFEIKDVVNDSFDCTDVDIVFINKLFSSLNSDLEKTLFLENFTSTINNLPATSLIIFNDRSEFALIDKFRNAIPESLFDLIGKYYIESSCCPRETDFVEISFDYVATNNHEKETKNKTTFLVFKKK